MAKRTRKRKRSKAQEEKRAKLLQNILNKPVFVRQNFGDGDQYLILLHRTTDENSHSKIEQVLLSGDPLQDGIYLITDYDIDMVFDAKEKKEILELRPKKFDLKVGKFAEEIITETYEDLKMHLVGAKYLTEDEFMLYCQSSKKPLGIEEILLSFDDYDQDREG